MARALDLLGSSAVMIAAALRVPLGTTGRALIDPRAPQRRVTPGKSLQIAAKK